MSFKSYNVSLEVVEFRENFIENQNQNTFISPTEGTFTLLQQKRAKDSLMLPKKHALQIIKNNDN